MRAAAKLLELYGEWRLWTEREFSALQAGQWPLLSEPQEAKSRLQPLINQASTAAASEWHQDETHATDERAQVRAMLHELIEMETRNEGVLASQVAVNVRERTQLQASRKNLARVQKSYGQRLPTAWQSYS